ncbi:MAG: 16S rRNA (guanine(966)-N(2))-methyltransferase RsmD [Hyphomicrobiales bacterium]|nr:16S rRNA (guanine(966)-N(2))-methyltransferase RsmD [Hyphomicrobiales bacterium]
MRIVGGALRGRPLQAPSGREIRPTSDRLRESLFNILQHRYDFDFEGAFIVDIFAGTGALGLEALSRGAAFALFVDSGADARALLRHNIEALGQGGKSRIFRRDATQPGTAPPGQTFDLALLDPPYGAGLADPCLAGLADGGWLKPGALVVVEETADAVIDAPPSLELQETRPFGATALHFFRFSVK